MKILNYSWHAGHQYELYKLPHDFTLLIRPGVSRWKFKQRPLNPRVRCLDEKEARTRDFDLAILHFDERVLDGRAADGHEQPFLYFNRSLSIPKAAICHGTPPLAEDGSIDEAKRRAVVQAVGDTWVVVNSFCAREAWGFERSVVIWHGFDPSEYGLSERRRDILTIGNFAQGRRRYQGRALFEKAAASLPCDLLWTRGEKEFRIVRPSKGGYLLRNLLFELLRGKLQRGYPERSAGLRRIVLNPYARGRFEAYRGLIRKYRIYFNPTRYSPMPRSRAEAMLCGLAVVTTNYQDEDRFIENGVNGFYSNDPEELVEKLGWLLHHPEEAEKLGRRGRETAVERISLDRFHREWESLIFDKVLAR